MSDRHKGYVVTLKDSIKDDDSKHIMNAIRMVKGVIAVDPVIENIDDHITKQKVQFDMKDKIWRVLSE